MKSGVPGLEVDFVRCIDARVSLIRHSPQLYRRRHGNYRLAMPQRFPYAIYFIWREAEGVVFVRRILHFVQDATKHLSG
jgi:hypothetical protein